jgi:uncharacterized protein (DUF2461 family)
MQFFRNPFSRGTYLSATHIGEIKARATEAAKQVFFDSAGASRITFTEGGGSPIELHANMLEAVREHIENIVDRISRIANPDRQNKFIERAITDLNEKGQLPQTVRGFEVQTDSRNLDVAREAIKEGLQSIKAGLSQPSLDAMLADIHHEWAR